MPRCGIHIVNCDIPIRFDSYIGCGYMCSYCNERVKGRQKKAPVIGEGRRALLNFIQGKRINTTEWCDWDIPLHWGVLSDPFQPCEIEYRHSLKLLREFALSAYPLIISTKSTMLLEMEYYSLLRHCNVVLQVSMVSPEYDSMESGPSFRDRFCSLYKLSKVVKRLLIRVQPYTMNIYDDVIKMLPAYKASGVYGLMVEGMKNARVTDEFPVRYGSSGVYQLDDLAAEFEALRAACHSHNLRFYSAENRLRFLGDSPTCCGVDDLPGFRPNRFNFNYPSSMYTTKMKAPGSGGVFTRSWFDKETQHETKVTPYSEHMESIRSGTSY